MARWMRNWLHRHRYRVTHASKFPKGDLVSFFLQLTRCQFRPRHIIDVGANHGKWSRKAYAVFPECTFTLVEPQREMTPHLDRFCQRVPGTRWICAGAGAEAGHLTLTVVPDTVSTSFTVSESAAKASNYERREVPIVTLDDIVRQENGRVPDLVKIDAEGWERQVMQGAQTLIGRTEVFLLEACFWPPPQWPSLLELLTMMADYGYEPFDFTTFQRQHGFVALTEVAFARRQGILRSQIPAVAHQARAA